MKNTFLGHKILEHDRPSDLLLGQTCETKRSAGYTFYATTSAAGAAGTGNGKTSGVGFFGGAPKDTILQERSKSEELEYRRAHGNLLLERSDLKSGHAMAIKNNCEFELSECNNSCLFLNALLLPTDSVLVQMVC